MSAWTICLILAFIFFLCGTFGVKFSDRFNPSWDSLGFAMVVLAVLLGGAPL